VLCLSFRVPPAVRPQSILIGKMIPEWIRQGVRPAVLTYDNNGDWRIDLPIYKIKQFSINRFFNKIPPLRRFLKKRYFEGIYKTAEAIVKERGINLVFSFSNPLESNILGAMLKERLCIKFIAHFSDPWSDNPYAEYSKRGREEAKRDEFFVIKKSDRVIFVNEQARKMIMAKYPPSWLEKTEVIPHCFRVEDYPAVEKKEAGGKFIISYIGVFYRQRNPEILFKALRQLTANRPDLADKFKIQLVGATNNYAGYSDDKIEEMLLNYNLVKQVESFPAVSYEESLRFMKLADCLIVIDADIADSPFLPSKAVDYAGSGAPIIGITPDHSPTADFLNNLGYKSFNYRQTDKLSDYLISLLDGKTELTAKEEFLKQYDVRETTAKLIKIFNSVI
jgi:glycosyltransferase involved in cell wall biosynthesis